MEKTLTQLSEDYFKAAEDINSLIIKYRRLLNEAYDSNDYLKTYELKRKLTVFYDQKRDILDTAYALKNYYKRSEEVMSA
ncbi:MAG: hypothetical protein J6K64_07140 [Clostridia bacterium]|nr:hypothetical protein [Clostridia bacterium]MBQ3128840.1 hypothetical protein [Clostridia bacterium]